MTILRNRKNIFFIALCLCCLELFLAGIAFSESDLKDSPKIKVKISKRTVRLSERLNLSISLSAEPDVEVEFPKEEGVLGNFEIKDSQTSQKQFLGKKIHTKIFTIASYDTGEQAIPQIIIRYRKPGGIWHQAVTNKIRLNVESVFKRSKIEADVKPIESQVSFGWPYKWHIIIGLTLLAFVAVLTLHLKKRWEIAEKAKKDVRADMVSYANLTTLLGRLKTDKGIGQSAIIDLAELIKQYLELRFKLSKSSMTTEEFLDSIKIQKPFYSKHGEPLSNFLRRSDMIKFAHYKIDPQEYIQSVSWARELVKEIRPSKES